jgi:hypothetical protein
LTAGHKNPSDNTSAKNLPTLSINDARASLNVIILIMVSPTRIAADALDSHPQHGSPSVRLHFGILSATFRGQYGLRALLLSDIIINSLVNFIIGRKQ